jgi:hypothetical protein
LRGYQGRVNETGALRPGFSFSESKGGQMREKRRHLTSFGAKLSLQRDFPLTFGVA